MLRDVYWRQYPIDLLSDDKMACVEAMLPDEQKHIPYMIYIAALKLCDDNGVFDLDDGVVLARLTRVKNVQLVIDIVNLMRQRKILYRLFDKSTLCGLVDWTYSDKRSRTIEERRKLVAERIQQEQTRAGVDKDFTLPGEQSATMQQQTAPAAAAPVMHIPDYIKKCKTCEAYDAAENTCTDPTDGACNRHWKPAAPEVQKTAYLPKQFEKCKQCDAYRAEDNSCTDYLGGCEKHFTAPEVQAVPAAQDFSCPENDKNAENVVISEMDDKNAENVVTLQTDNTIQDTGQTNIQDIQTNTHTQQQLSGYGPIEGPPPDNCQDNAGVAEKIQNQNTENANTLTEGDDICENDISSLAEMALQEQQKSVEKKDTGQLETYLNDFFVKNCYGYKPKQSRNAIYYLAEEILEISDEMNPPEAIASVLCSEFKKMCEGGRGDYWKGMPLLPSNMLKPRVKAELLQYAGKILATTKNCSKFIEAQKKAQEECENEKNNVGDAIREEYLKYNIDPNDAQAQRKLLSAKSKEQEAARNAEIEAEAEAAEGFDIF